jgi:hypothetical protein
VVSVRCTGAAAANRQPALAVYAQTDGVMAYKPFASKVFTMNGGLISAITDFVTPGLFAAFDLSATYR